MDWEITPWHEVIGTSTGPGLDRRLLTEDPACDVAMIAINDHRSVYFDCRRCLAREEPIDVLLHPWQGDSTDLFSFLTLICSSFCYQLDYLRLCDRSHNLLSHSLFGSIGFVCSGTPPGADSIK